jgi:hypothetical protein
MCATCAAQHILLEQITVIICNAVLIMKLLNMHCLTYKLIQYLGTTFQACLQIKLAKMCLLAAPSPWPHVTIWEWPNGFSWSLILGSVTKISCQHIPILVNNEQQQALYWKTNKLFCMQKWLGGESPGYLSYHGYLGNPLPPKQLWCVWYHIQWSKVKFWQKNSNSGKWARTVMPCIHFLTFFNNSHFYP